MFDQYLLLNKKLRDGEKTLGEKAFQERHSNEKLLYGKRVIIEKKKLKTLGKYVLNSKPVLVYYMAVASKN